MSVENVTVRSKSPNLYVDSDDTIRELNKKRGSIKGRLTLFVKFVNSVRSSSHPSDKQVTELKLRSELAKSLFNEFNSIQSSIEMLMVLDSDTAIQLEHRESFENSYYETMAEANSLIKRFSLSESTSNDSKCEASLNKLPTISLPSFDGSFENWLEFRDTYLSMIHNSTQLDDIRKFHYLRTSLSGQAAQVIKSIECTSGNYKMAWDLLNERYNNTKLLVHNHVKALFTVQNLNKETSFHLRKLIDTVSKNLRALKTLGEPTEYWDTLIIYIITSKLDAVVEKEWEEHKNNLYTQHHKSIKLDNLITFLKNKADTLEMIKAHNSSSISNSKVPFENSKKQSQSQQKSHIFASTKNNVNSKSTTCSLCSGNHSLYSCTKFLDFTVNKRLEFVNNKKLCVNCLRAGHSALDCYFGPCKKCNRKHNSLLHSNHNDTVENALLSVVECQPDSNPVPHSSAVLHTAEPTRNENANNTLYTQASETVLLSTALVEIAGSDNVYHKARALLDSGSQHCLITEKLRKKINVDSIQSAYHITGIGHSHTQSTESCEIKLRSLNGDYNTRFKCIVLKHITSTLPSVPIHYNSLDIPNNIQLADSLFYLPSQIDLLIGADVFWELLIEGKMRLPAGPYLQNTTLGWIISGIVYNLKSVNKKLQCHHIQSIQLNEQLRKFWELEENFKPKQYLTEEERHCENLFSETTKRVVDGRFSVRIPVRNTLDELGDSYDIAKNRFLSLERRLERSPEYKKMYCDFMQEYLGLGHMTRIENYASPHYFLPHHGVLREQSTTTKLRVVFNASQKTSSGKSLNDVQMAGPALQSELFSIILRFRQYKFVACADIEKMFR